MMKKLLILSTAVLLVGCVAQESYEQPKRPSSYVIKCYSGDVLVEEVTVDRVNSKHGYIWGYRGNERVFEGSKGANCYSIKVAR